MGNAFLDASSVVPLGGDRYGATIDERWSLRPLPQGGLVTALAVRAMEASLERPDQRLRTLHTTFVDRVEQGPVEVEVEVLRQGRSMSHARAEVRNRGAARGHITNAVFGGSRRGFEFTDLEPPSDIPAPGDCPSFRDPPPPGFELAFPPMPFWDELIEGRSVSGHPPWEDYEPDRAHRVMWYGFDEPPMLDDGSLDPLALIVLADTMPGAVGEKVGHTDRNWFAPSVDLTVHLLGEATSPWLLADNWARHAADGYASADMALWDCGPRGAAEPRLVAYATQLFFFAFAD
jgi:acyl-CoA thioesterase